MESNFLRKSFFIITLCIILISVRVVVDRIKIENILDIFNNTTIIEKKVQDENQYRSEVVQKSSKDQSLKYMLRWTSSKTIPFVYMGEGQQGFIDRNCSNINCYVTGDRNYLDDYRKFDVILFHGPEIVRMKQTSLPSKRSSHQKFVFGSLESPDYYPVCSKRFDGYFNWTWTFKLNSDSRWGYIVVRDADNNVIGPKIDMHWMKFEDMEPVTDDFKEELKTKTKAAAWFVSNCDSRGGRQHFVKKLQNELLKYNQTIHIYGGCGNFTCPKDKEECNAMIKKDYYFYLSFENSFSEDYVTEKLLTSLKHTTIPIVYGGANYSRFMPDGIYLNAMQLGVEKLAAKMDELIKNPTQYAEYFRWKKYYSYHDPEESVDTNDYCRFCEILFDKDLMKETTVYHNFRQWWDPPNRC